MLTTEGTAPMYRGPKKSRARKEGARVTRQMRKREATQARRRHTGNCLQYALPARVTAQSC